jgi:hypothetical protein
VDGGMSDLSEDGNPPIANGSWLDHVDTGLGMGAGLMSNTSVHAGPIVPNVVQTTVGMASGSSGTGTMGFMSDDGATAPSLPHAVEGANVPVEALTIPSGASVTQMTTNSDGSISEAVSFAGSNITFNNTFASGASNAFINCALSAEQTIANQWTTPNAVTLNESFTAQAEGQNGELASNGFYYEKFTYSSLLHSLQTLSHNEPTNTYLQQVVAHLPASDPSGAAATVADFAIPLPYARMLGLTTDSMAAEDAVTLNTSYSWSYGQDVVNTLVHEISEGGMGRIGNLGDGGLWSTMDLFRYNSSGVADYTNGRDGRTTYFSYNGGATLSSLSYNNQFNTGGSQVNGGDTADFTQLDVFGTGSPGETNTLSQTDIQIMEALGWMAPVQGPVVSASTVNLSATSVAASSLFTVSDPNGLAITLYDVEDTGPGEFSLAGAPLSNGSVWGILPSQLSQLTYVAGPQGTADTVQIRASDSLGFGSWTTFTVNAPQLLIQTDTNAYGTTKLAEIGYQYALENGAGNGPHLIVNGAPVVVTQMGGWTAIGAALTAAGYEIAWKLGSSFIIWTTDSNGNMLSISPVLSGTSYSVESSESSFNQDLNGDGTIGVISHVIETNGTTSLVAVADQYAFEDSHGNGPHLQLDGAPVVAGQFASWSPVAATQTASGYDVAWQSGSSFIIWTADSTGQELSISPVLSGTSATLENYETIFGHDLNGDGTIGPVPTIIESNGTTSLVLVGNQYAIEDSHGNGPILQLNGAPVVDGQFASWSPVAAAQTASGYDVAWQSGSSFIIWTTDSNGNEKSISPVLSGTSYALENSETAFGHDLNGDGTIGITSHAIETNGTTSLVAVADQYALEDSHGNGPILQLNGAPVVEGQFASWSPVAAAQTASGYDVAWQSGSSFIIWTTDSNGNEKSISPVLSGTSYALETYETTFGHDLNGDGTIGVTSTVLETNGTTSLVAVANQYALEDSHGNGPILQLNGAPVVAGQFSPWTLVAAAQTATGYDVAWQSGSSFIIWTTDSNGSETSVSPVFSGTSTSLENYETVFNHDLNGDGVIGAPPGGGAPAAVVATTQNFAFRDTPAAPSSLAPSSQGSAMDRAVSHLHGFNFQHFDHGTSDATGNAGTPPATPVSSADGLVQDAYSDGTYAGAPGGSIHPVAPHMHIWHFDLSA